MKVVIVLSLFIACVAACCITPDWTSVEAKTNEIKDIFTNSAKEIVSIAIAENKFVGIRVEARVRVATLDAAAILYRTNKAITTQSLSEPEAKVLVGQLRGTIGKLKGSVHEVIYLLTQESADQIRAIFDDTFDEIGIRQEELYQLLRWKN